ncbi:hypothetical protein O1Q82_00095 [Lonepinella sp. MS14437]
MRKKTEKSKLERKLKRVEHFSISYDTKQREIF